jgi:hypothetical protein
MCQLTGKVDWCPCRGNYERPTFLLSRYMSFISAVLESQGQSALLLPDDEEEHRNDEETDEFKDNQPLLVQLLNVTQQLLTVDHGRRLLLFLATIALKNNARARGFQVTMMSAGGAGSNYAAFLRVLSVLHAAAKTAAPTHFFAHPWGDYHCTATLCSVIKKCRSFSPDCGAAWYKFQVGWCKQAFPLLQIGPGHILG